MNMPKQQYVSAYDVFKTSRSVPAWFAELQEESIGLLKKKGFPTHRDEDWRYTNVDRIVNAMPLFGFDGGAALDLNNSENKFLNQLKNRLVFVDGAYSADLSLFPDWQQGVKVLQLQEALDARAEEIKSIMGHFKNEQAFDWVNTAFSQQGVFIRVGDNVSISEPLHLVHLVTKNHVGDEVPFVNVKNLILVGAYSQVNFVESFVSYRDSRAFCNVTTDAVVCDGAHVTHTKIQALSQNDDHVASLRIAQETNSSVETFSFSIGAKLSRQNIEMISLGENTHSGLDGLYVLAGDQLCDHHTILDHQKPHATSHQLYKGVLDDKSHAVFNGRVIIRQDAQKIDSKQLNKNLILGDKARVDTKPQLEISADDVKCAHGATIGQINSEDLFYFESRGIPKDQARKLLVRGFAEDVVAKIKQDGTRRLVDELLVERFFNEGS